MKSNNKQISDKIIGKNGIYFDNDIELIYEKDHISRIFFILQIFIAFISVYCTSLLFESFIHTTVSIYILAFYSFISVLTFSLFKLPHLKAKIISSVSLAAVLSYLIINVTRVKLGFFVVADDYLLAIKSNYTVAGNLSGITPENVVQLASCFYFAAIMLLAFIVTAAVIYKTNFPLMFLVTFAIVELVLYWTFKVSVTLFIWLVVCWISVLAMQFTNHNAKHKYKSHTFSMNRRCNTYRLTSTTERSRFNGLFISFVCILTAVIFCASFILSSITQLFTSPKSFKIYKDKITNAINNISVEKLISEFDSLDGKNIGGTNSGQLGTYSEISFNGDTMLEITTEHFDNTLYLRGYVAGDYKDNCWQVSDASNQSFVDMFKKKNMLVQDLDYNIAASLAKKYNDFEKKNMTIKVKGADDEYLYAPYGADYSNIKISGIFKPEPTYESYIKLGSSKYNLNYYNIDSIVDINEFSEENFEQDFIAENETAVEQYENYINTTYSYYDNDNKQNEKLLSAYDVIMSNYIGNNDIIDICNGIKQYFQDNYTYTLSPGKTPEGEDFVEYFLGSQKKGYCTYFASAGVLLLRMFGIPARYVEGYKVAPPKNQPDNSQFTFEVKDYSAHAWAEIYVSGIGWLPVEFTPPSDVQSNSTAIVNSVTDTSSLTDSKTDINSSLTNSFSDNSHNNDTGFNSKSDIGSTLDSNNQKDTLSSKIIGVLNILVEILLLLCVVLLVLVINRAVKLKKKKTLCSQNNTNERVKSIFRYTLKYISLLDININKNLTDTQICEEIIKQCDKYLIPINKDNLRKLCHIAEKAHMSNKIISEQYAEQAKEIMDSITENTVKSHLSKIKRLAAIFIYGLY